MVTIDFCMATNKTLFNLVFAGGAIAVGDATTLVNISFDSLLLNGNQRDQLTAGNFYVPAASVGLFDMDGNDVTFSYRPPNGPQVVIRFQ